MASPWENDHQYISTNGKKPPKLASKDLSSDWSKIYGATGQLRNVEFQAKGMASEGASNGNWNTPTHTAKPGKKPAGL